ncbi:MAG TPA: FeoB-associated Cys-rich membrane protein [Gemmata sp.]|nr:FeoB-associated Cys-rich membrane protein [Gemmata sp.]
MSDTLQLLAVGAIVAAAVGLLLRYAWRAITKSSTKSCGSGCHHCAIPEMPDKQDGRFPLKQI